MKRKHSCSICKLAICLFAFLMTSCIQLYEDPDLSQPVSSKGKPVAYVAVGLSTSSSPLFHTRNTPTGGEFGDGTENGQVNENIVDNIWLFFYEASGAPNNSGVNMSQETPIVAHKLLETGEFEYMGTTARVPSISIENLMVDRSYHVLAVVNGKDVLNGAEITTLGELRQKTAASLYTRNENGYTSFLMSSATDESSPLYIARNNSPTVPATTRIEVERTVARVDYQALGTVGEAPGIYLVENQNKVLGRARITGALLINTLNDDYSNWLFKRVSDTWSFDNPVFLGDEQTDPLSGTASNYVMDAVLEKDHSVFVPETYFPNIGYDDLSWESMFQEESLLQGLEDGFLCVGYPKENINRQGSQGATTGIVFRAVYTPEGMTEGSTFFEWNSELYVSLEELMQTRFADDWLIINTPWNDVLTWEDLRRNILPNLQDDPVGYRRFLSEQAGERSGTILPEEKELLSWSKYLEMQCHYTHTLAGVKVDVNAEAGTTRRLLNRFGGIATYKEGICYYTYWIKHASDGVDDNDLIGKRDNTGGVMEYAIVRNNVYKLSITSISNPGNDIPGNRNIHANLLVQDWQMLPEETVELQPQ